MRRVVKTGLVVLGAGAALLAAMTAIGAALPVAHQESREALIPAPRERIYAAIEDVGRYPEWRSGVERIERDTTGHGARWVEHGTDGAIPYEVVDRRPGEYLVTRIADDDLPFGGTWSIALADAPGGTLVRITENGEVYNPLFRFMSRYVFGHAAGIERYLAELSARFSGAARPSPEGS